MVSSLYLFIMVETVTEPLVDLPLFVFIGPLQILPFPLLYEETIAPVAKLLFKRYAKAQRTKSTPFMKDCINAKNPSVRKMNHHQKHPTIVHFNLICMVHSKFWHTGEMLSSDTAFFGFAGTALYMHCAACNT